MIRCVLAVAMLVACATPTHAASIEWVRVGDPGNVTDTTGYGAVADAFWIGKYETTIGQYCDFLNATARTDTYSLYNASMGTNLNIAGIVRSGSSGSYTYAVMTNGGTSANRPITFVSWFDAARFANWMHNGQLTGTAGAASTETGAYTLNGATTGVAPVKNPGALYAIPTENQWYKAAYYKGSGTNAGYWTYATRSNSAPGNVIGSGSNQANYAPGSRWSVTQSTSYSASQNYLSDVGAFTSSSSAYGTFDQAGGVYEWNDLNGVAGTTRGFRGGVWQGDAFNISSAARNALDPAVEGNGSGFRLVTSVPEPATLGLVAVGVAGGILYLARRRA